MMSEHRLVPYKVNVELVNLKHPLLKTLLTKVIQMTFVIVRSVFHMSLVPVFILVFKKENTIDSVLILLNIILCKITEYCAILCMGGLM